MDIDKQIITKSAQETAGVGQELGNWIKKRGARAVCLYGELGSGKTTFVQGFAKAFGITSRLLSPTFIIVRRYPFHQNSRFLYHVDLYRTEGKKDLVSAGLPELLADPDCVVLIEWAEKLGGLIPDHRVDARFSVREDGEHTIIINKLT